MQNNSAGDTVLVYELFVRSSHRFVGAFKGRFFFFLLFKIQFQKYTFSLKKKINEMMILVGVVENAATYSYFVCNLMRMHILRRQEGPEKCIAFHSRRSKYSLGVHIGIRQTLFSYGIHLFTYGTLKIHFLSLVNTYKTYKARAAHLIVCNFCDFKMHTCVRCFNLFKLKYIFFYECIVSCCMFFMATDYAFLRFLRYYLYGSVLVGIYIFSGPFIIVSIAAHMNQIKFRPLCLFPLYVPLCRYCPCAKPWTIVKRVFSSQYTLDLNKRT